VRRALAAPFFLADEVVVNSAAARRVLLDAAPRLAERVTVVHNGVLGPPAEPQPPRRRQPGDPARLALVGRLSPRKGIDVALEAVATLVAQGRDVELIVCGTPFPGYEWYEQELAARAAEPDLAGRVHLAGYVHPTWDVLADADVVLVPSRVEPFGNTAAEALLARRPVVASAVQGLAEVVRDGRTGVLVPPGDGTGLAAAVGSLLDDPERARGLADQGLADARRRFSTERYGRDVVEALDRCRGARR
jgi:glycosyltransferase involved in cell wall biosynthesis